MFHPFYRLSLSLSTFMFAVKGINFEITWKLNTLLKIENYLEGEYPVIIIIKDWIPIGTYGGKRKFNPLVGQDERTA